MKNFSKFLSMFLVVVMCFGLFATSAFADFDFGQGSSNANGLAGFGYGNEVEPTTTTANTEGGFTANLSDLEAQEKAAATAATTTAAADDDEDEAEEAAPAVSTQQVLNVEGTNSFQFGGSATTQSTENTASASSVYNSPYADNAEWTFKVNKTDFKKSSPDDVKITGGNDTDKFDGDTFNGGIAYSTSATGSDLTRLVQGSHYSLDSKGLTIYGSWLKTLDPGTYYFYGLRTTDVPVKLGFINVNKETYTGTITVLNSPFDKSVNTANAVSFNTTTATDFSSMEAFGVASVSGSYTYILSVNDYDINTANTLLTLSKSYLKGLTDGTYYLIGFPNGSSMSEQVNLGKFIVKGSGLLGGLYTLTPDYQMWYSGTDPLTFYSSLFEDAGLLWNYKGYGEDVIVPDVLVSTRSSMSGATSVRIDQYWDLGYGYFMLGTNFLSSLSADETYYMQVVDARHPDQNYTNVVSFRVGPTLRAIDTDKHVINSTRSLRFRSSSPISEVYVGNIQLTDPADYGVSWDGKTVTLSFEFLNKRSAGNTYTLKVRTTSGEWAATTFQVLTTAQGSASPRTGDESNLGLWAAFLLLSGTAVVVLVPKLRKQDF